jgi:hypothetical protein
MVLITNTEVPMFDFDDDIDPPLTPEEEAELQAFSDNYVDPEGEEDFSAFPIHIGGDWNDEGFSSDDE